MKKLIFGLMAFMLLFFVVSCDDGSKANSSSLGTNPYENLEKSLTVKLNSIDEVEFSDGEWEFYYESYYKEIGYGAEKEEVIGIMTVDHERVSIEYSSSKSFYQFFDLGEYLIAKGECTGEDDYTFDDMKKVISMSQEIPESEIYKYEEYVSSFDYFFCEDSKEETEEYCEAETYLVKTNSTKDAFIFFVEEKYEDLEMSEVYEEKYIFKKVK